MQHYKEYFAGMVAVVTGGASGVGLALAEELLENKAAQVILVDFNRENLGKRKEQLSQKHTGKVSSLLCDVTQEAAVKDMIEEACSLGGGRIDLLVNCAGADFSAKFTLEPDGIDPENPFLNTVATQNDWERAFALNFFGALYGCRYAVPIMLEQGCGQVVNIISGAAFTPMAYQSMYSATKAALNALTLSLRAEYARYGIKFNSATPGTTATAIFDKMGGAPSQAQSPKQSASRVLAGVAKNDRLILGDDSDVEGAEHAFIPEPYARITDRIYLGFARTRRSGTLSYIPDDVSEEVVGELSDKEVADLRVMADIFGPDASDIATTTQRLRAYLARRDADSVPEEYFVRKTAVVTGAASGIGLALCEEMLEYGASQVVLSDYNNKNLEDQVTRLSQRYPGQVKGIVCDVSKEKEVNALMASATEFFEGDFDLLINNAGIGQSGLFAEVPSYDREQAQKVQLSVESQDHWNQIFSVNFYGALYGCRAVLPIMLTQGKGQIVNIISGTAFSGMPYQSLYASAKAALNALTLTLRYEYWDQGLVFNAATPGTTATAIFGEGAIPPSAQTPKQSALRILTGIAYNDRLIFGDDSDAENAMIWGNARASSLLDEVYAQFALTRFSGELPEYGTGE